MNPQTQTAEDKKIIEEVLEKKRYEHVYPYNRDLSFSELYGQSTLQEVKVLLNEALSLKEREVRKEVEGIIDKRIEFNKKEVIKHFNNNKKSPSNTQVKKELRHRFIVNELKELKQALKDNSSQERCQQKQNKDISLSALDSGYSADTHNITTNISLDELKRYKNKEVGIK